MNGHFLRYHMVFMNQDDPDRYLDMSNDRCWTKVTQKEGHYFKVSGLFGTEGPYGEGDMRYSLPF